MTLSKDGFTLIELMIVVAIIGILVSIATPGYLAYSAKSKQVEAKTNLGAIYMAQISYRGEKDTYTGTIGLLDWAAAGATRYTYSISSSSTIAFQADATANIDSDLAIDAWNINENKVLSNTTNDVNS